MSTYAHLQGPVTSEQTRLSVGLNEEKEHEVFGHLAPEPLAPDGLVDVERAAGRGRARTRGLVRWARESPRGLCEQRVESAPERVAHRVAHEQLKRDRRAREQRTENGEELVALPRGGARQSVQELQT